MDTKHIKISDYNYSLPDERIAKFPIAQRDHSKLLVYKHGVVSDDVFYHLPDYLPKGALMSLKFWFIINTHASSVLRSCILGSM